MKRDARSERTKKAARCWVKDKKAARCWVRTLDIQFQSPLSYPILYCVLSSPVYTVEGITTHSCPVLPSIVREGLRKV